MAKYKAIPPGYMTVGEIAGKMGVTVRTLQYYNKAGLLCPSAQSEGGRRLYTDKDLIKLHQILSLKFLGFSLEDIKKRLIPLDNPADVAQVLFQQAGDIRKKIEALSESLSSLEKLRIEVLQMQAVDFKKYADIIVNLQLKNEYYYLIKHFDDDVLDHIRCRFDQKSGLDFIKRFQRIKDEVLLLQKSNEPPDSEKSQHAAESFWKMVMEFTCGDMRLLLKLKKLGNLEGAQGAEGEWEHTQAIANAFLEPALEIYFARAGVHPFEEETE